METGQQAAAEGHAKKEQQLRNALDRLQALAQQSQGEAVPRAPPDGRLQAAQARCDRAEARLSVHEAKTKQVCGLHPC